MDTQKVLKTVFNDFLKHKFGKKPTELNWFVVEQSDMWYSMVCVTDKKNAFMIREDAFLLNYDKVSSKAVLPAKPIEDIITNYRNLDVKKLRYTGRKTRKDGNDVDILEINMSYEMHIRHDCMKLFDVHSDNFYRVPLCDCYGKQENFDSYANSIRPVLVTNMFDTIVAIIMPFDVIHK